ncbi:MAG: tyrosine-type recombinase/integrase [Solobacterium sp.]|nr:tyrosine-type recombinase/integrase [Solobacterium sp.]
MNYKRLMRFMPNERKEQLQKVIDTLRIGGRSEKTISNYVYAINRFFEYFKNEDISKFDEDNILEYIKQNYLSKSCAGSTYNMNICAIKYFYSVNFNKEFNSKLLPHAKLAKKIPSTIDKDIFIKIFNEEENLKHKCWLLLAYCSGLRVEEIARLKIENINSKEHQLKVYGKRKKERITVLTDITIDYLRLYYRTTYYYSSRNNKGYLFEGNQCADHINSGSITNYFTALKYKYELDENISFHSLRHSFASNFIKGGGDPFVLKSMLGHTSLNTTNIYIHMGRDFNNLKGVNYEQI